MSSSGGWRFRHPLQTPTRDGPSRAAGATSAGPRRAPRGSDPRSAAPWPARPRPRRSARSAVEALELEVGQGVVDARDLVRRERDEVRVAAHEADPVAVGDDLDDVAAEQGAGAARAPAPEADRAALEVAAEADELVVVVDGQAVRRPQLDALGRARDPLAVGLVEEDPRVEALGPVGHAGVVVRVRDRDRVHVAQARLAGVVGGRHAVPHEAARDERALPDGQRGVQPDAEQAGLDLLDARAVRGGDLLAREPGLPAPADVLALVLADRAVRGRLGRRREAGGAGGAEPSGHGGTLDGGARR